MAEEQRKLANLLPDVVAVLATGNRDGVPRAPGVATDFAPATSLHIGVVSTDMGVSTAPALPSCGALSFNPTAPNPNSAILPPDPPSNAERLDKPFGDDGVLQTSTTVAVAGMTRLGTAALVVPPDPSCADASLAQRYVSYEAGQPFEAAGHALGCIAKLGRNGCGLEQQLEAALKALGQSDGDLQFSRSTSGYGDPAGLNAGFLREDAVLAIVQLSDEDDCSLPDGSNELFNPASTVYPENINLRCNAPQHADKPHPISRYVSGLRALKGADYRDRFVVTSIVGLPVATPGGVGTHAGSSALDTLLALPEMQFTTVAGPGLNLHQASACANASDGAAVPGRRLLQLTRAFGDDGIAASICEDDYAPALALMNERVARHLGSCEE